MATDFNKVFTQLIEEGGKIRVLYMNGIRTTEDQFKENLIGFDQIWNLQGKLVLPGKCISRGSIDLDTQYRNTTDSTGNDWLDLGVFVGKFLFEYALSQISFGGIIEQANKHKALKKKFEQLKKEGKDVTEIAEQIDDLKDIADFFGTINTGIELAESFTKLSNPADLVKDDDFTAKAILFIKEVAGFIPGFGNIVDVIDSMIESAPEDLKESLEQYWYAESKFQDINNTWTNSAKEWLSSHKHNPFDNNSLILLGHSQGNFFLEDGLIDMGAQNDPSRIRVLALASPTSYLNAGGINLYKGSAVPNNNIKNSGDPVTFLQLESEPFVWTRLVKYSIY